MALHRFRIFTLEQANRLLPLIEELTQHTRERLDALRAAPAEPQQEPGTVERQTRIILEQWARMILELGAQPKGIFTVDFRSPDPNVLWCWAPEESKVSHRHFTWESFKDRVPIEQDGAAWPSWN